MGQFFTQTEFTPQDFSEFGRCLQHQLAELHNLLKAPLAGDNSPTSIGAELELYLVDKAFAPLNVNQTLIDKLANPLLQEELNQYNLEFNLEPVLAKQSPFTQMRQQMDETVGAIQRQMSESGGLALPIGILPTLQKQHLGLQYMTDLPRYRVLTERLAAMRGDDFVINIQGEESVSTTCSDVTLEGANTSFQLHLKVPSNRFKELFNAAQLVTPLVTAIAANSPIFLGKKLWQETRIALFKQSIDSRHEEGQNWRSPARVTYGQGWVRDGMWELFAENASIFEPIIPLKIGKPFGELCLHHGTVWNWNRAVFAPGVDAHSRIEFRSLPAGPTSLDMMANAALLIGLTHAFADDIDQFISRLPFKYAEYNFYRAAQYGFEANLIWPALNQHRLREQGVVDILMPLLPAAQHGLESIGVAHDEATYYLDVIRQRLERQQNGATWQVNTVNRYLSNQSHDQALQSMLREYVDNVAVGNPVAQWE